ncbi:MAG: PH domain-containing protein [Candidatus Delongbacteria bacterium]|nr:PH domain-containing protein [Candidatus Delongbacteria bacterium]
MSYIQDNLMPKEKILFQARVHPAVFLPAIVAFVGSIAMYIYASYVMSIQKDAGMLLLAVIFILGIGGFFVYSIFLSLRALIVLLTTEFAVTNRRVIAKRGFIRRHTLEMLLPKIESVSVRQNLLGRLLNFGTVTVTGTGGTKESFNAIVGPIVVRKKINQIIEAYMQAYNRYQQQQTSNSNMVS